MLAASDHREEAPLGVWARCSTHPKMWMLNQLHVVGPQPDLTAEAFLAELDRGLADVGHRRAQVSDDVTGRRLAEDVRKLEGYNVMPLLVMLLDREPPEPPPGFAREVDAATMRALDEQIVAADAGIPAHDKPVVVEGHEHLRDQIPGTRSFVGSRDGVDACAVTLYCDGRTGQPEDVNTLAEHRGHGLAAATVSLAARAATASGADLVFIVCDAAEGPFPLYASLGFRAAGRYWSFTKPDPPTPSRRPPA